MLLKLPLWRYPVVVIFTLLMHGILVYIMFIEYKRNPAPSQIEWFELRELQLPIINKTETNPSSPKELPKLSSKSNIPVQSKIIEQNTTVTEPPTVVILPVRKKPDSTKKMNSEGSPSCLIKAFGSYKFVTDLNSVNASLGSRL